MNNDERRKNLDQYIGDIGQAIENLVIRCGGTLNNSNDKLPRELVVRQRVLFIHAGMSGIMSKAIMEQDDDMINFLDWLLGYHVNKDYNGGKDRPKFISTMLRALHDQLLSDCNDDEGSTIVAGMILLRLASLVIGGHASQEEVNQIHMIVMSILTACMAREIEQRRQDTKKN